MCKYSWHFTTADATAQDVRKRLCDALGIPESAADGIDVKFESNPIPADDSLADHGVMPRSVLQAVSPLHICVVCFVLFCQSTRCSHRTRFRCMIVCQSWKSFVIHVQTWTSQVVTMPATSEFSFHHVGHE